MPYVDKEMRRYVLRQHYLDNMDQYKDRCSMWRVMNKDRAKELRKKYYDSHKEIEYKNKIKWREKNKEKNLEYSRKVWSKHKDFYNCIRRLKTKLKNME